MKKLLTILLGVAGFSFANAGQMSASGPLADPQCKPAMEHMHASRIQIEEAIKANDANKVGKLVIQDHKYMETFIASHPQCKMHHPMPPMMQENPSK